VRKGTLHIGTSGWHYEHWKGPFYPEDHPASAFLAFYAERFGTAEINNSFYRMPGEKTFLQWRDSVPGGFVFAVKASRYITHMKKLKDPADPVDKFMKRAGLLGDKLGPVLFQLPPNWGFNAERLESFLKSLPRGYRYALEFRDRSWWCPEARESLARAGAAFCIFDLDGELSPREVTADFVYIRLHGPDGPYRGSYTDRTLSAWAGDLAAWAAGGRDVYCYFDNDEAGYAPLNAMRLIEMAGKKNKRRR
jgi:uncharacterized protein YecE (DUF72 family)